MAKKIYQKNYSPSLPIREMSTKTLLRLLTSTSTAIIKKTSNAFWREHEIKGTLLNMAANVDRPSHSRSV